MVDAYGWLPNPLTVGGLRHQPATARATPTRSPTRIVPLTATIDIEFPANGSSNTNLDHFAYHNYFTGPAGYSGLKKFIEIIDGVRPNGTLFSTIPDPDNPPNGTMRPPVALGCCSCQITQNAPPSCNAGGPYPPDCHEVHVNGASASDPEGEALTYAWTSSDPTVTVTPAVGMLPAGNGPHSVPDTTASYNGPTCPLTVTLTLTVTDPEGSSSTCTVDVTFRDDSAPTINTADESLTCGQTPAPATVSDNCDPNPTLTFSDQTSQGNCPDNYTITRTWTASDHCGNSSTRIQTITYSDTTPPVITGVPPDQTTECPDLRPRRSRRRPTTARLPCSPTSRRT